MSKILILDIEASNLDADMGIMLCFGYKWLGDKKITVVSITDFPQAHAKDPTNDYYVVKEAMRVMAEADMWVFHYGEYYDLPFIRTRALEHKLGPLPKTPFVDTWRIAKKRLKLTRNSLANLAEFLGLPSKTPVTKRVWRRAMSGHIPSIDYVVDHCRQDILVEELTYLALRPYWEQHPNLSIIENKKDGCPECGSSKLQRRGHELAQKKVYQRFQCQGCGKWSRGKVEDLGKKKAA